MPFNLVQASSFNVFRDTPSNPFGDSGDGFGFAEGIDELEQKLLFGVCDGCGPLFLPDSRFFRSILSVEPLLSSHSVSIRTDITDSAGSL